MTAERARQSVGDIFLRLRSVYGNVAAALAAVTVVELAHGIERAQTDTQRQRRQAFLNDLTANMTVYPLTSAIAELAGLLRSESQPQRESKRPPVVQRIRDLAERRRSQIGARFGELRGVHQVDCFRAEGD